MNLREFLKRGLKGGWLYLVFVGSLQNLREFLKRGLKAQLRIDIRVDYVFEES